MPTECHKPIFTFTNEFAYCRNFQEEYLSQNMHELLTIFSHDGKLFGLKNLL